MTIELKDSLTNSSRREQIGNYIKKENLILTTGVDLCAEGTALSVVIPAFNEEESIEATLRSLDSSETPVEIIVVDNGSNDNTISIAKNVASVMQNQVTILSENTKGPVHARKRGMDEVVTHYYHKGLSQTRYIAITDADTIIPSNWASEIIRVGQEEQCDAMGGPFSYSEELDEVIEKHIGIPKFFRNIAEFALTSTRSGLSIVNTYGPNTAIEILPYVQIDGSRQPTDKHGNKVKGSDIRYGNELRTRGGKVSVLPIMTVTSARRAIYSLANDIDQSLLATFQGWVDIRDDDVTLLTKVIDSITTEDLKKHREDRLASFIHRTITMPIVTSQIEFTKLQEIFGEKHPLLLALIGIKDLYIEDADLGFQEQSKALARQYSNEIYNKLMKINGN